MSRKRKEAREICEDRVSILLNMRLVLLLQQSGYTSTHAGLLLTTRRYVGSSDWEKEKTGAKAAPGKTGPALVEQLDCFASCRMAARATNVRR